MTADTDWVPSIVDQRYGDLTGRGKCDHVFDAGIRATAYGESLPSVRRGIVQFVKSAAFSVAHELLRETLTRGGDELDSPKHKLFHTYGTTAKIVFEPEPGTPYTGIFGREATGLLRFSYAGPVLGVGIVPGLGLKFFVDGDHPSENAVLMRTLDRQSQRSVFQYPFTNILPTPRFTNVVMRVVKHRFETVVEQGRGLHQPVENLARVEASGHRVDGEVRAPYRVILVPTEDARRGCDPSLDFRDDLARNLPSGTTIYEVLALDEPDEAALREHGARHVEDLIPHAARIGALTTRSEFVASKYGDFRLFFKHSDVFLRGEPGSP